MIQETGGIPVNIAVEVELVVQGENVGIVQLTLPEGFLFIDFPANVFDEVRAVGDINECEAAGAVNLGIREIDQCMSMHVSEGEIWEGEANYRHNDVRRAQKPPNSSAWKKNTGLRRGTPA